MCRIIKYSVRGTKSIHIIPYSSVYSVIIPYSVRNGIRDLTDPPAWFDTRFLSFFKLFGKAYPHETVHSQTQ